MSFESFDAAIQETPEPIPGVDNVVALGPDAPETVMENLQQAALEDLKAFKNNPDIPPEKFLTWSEEAELSIDRQKKSNEARLDFQLARAEMYIQAGLLDQAQEELTYIEFEVESQNLTGRGYEQAIAVLRGVEE